MIIKIKKAYVWAFIKKWKNIACVKLVVIDDDLTSGAYSTNITFDITKHDLITEIRNNVLDSGYVEPRIVIADNMEVTTKKQLDFSYNEIYDYTREVE